MDKITAIGLDLAKNVFHVVCTNRRRNVGWSALLAVRSFSAFPDGIYDL